MNDTDGSSDRAEGLRERKRRETFDRIAETGLRLFIENGYDATTLDAIAAAAGISRRTFFYYFKSKEEVLVAHEGSGFLQALRSAMLEASPERTPLGTARDCLLKLASRYETEQSIIVDQLLRSTEALRARKDALYIEMERTLVEAMRELWPEPPEPGSLRVAAMMAVGALRLALDDWRREAARHALAYHLRRNFALLESQF